VPLVSAPLSWVEQVVDRDVVWMGRQFNAREVPNVSDSEISVVDLLKRDHQKVASRLARLDSVPVSDLESYFCELREELVRHEVAEELIVYPVVREKVPNGDSIANSCIAEQSQAEEELVSLERGEANSESFRSELDRLRAAVIEHAHHEEREVLPALSEHITEEELKALGARYERAIKAAPTHPHPHAPDQPPGNKALGPMAALIDRIRDAMKRGA
jgi:hemerythrin superfamily protein